MKVAGPCRLIAPLSCAYVQLSGLVDPQQIDMLEDHCSRIQCPGVLETTWSAYKDFTAQREVTLSPLAVMCSLVSQAENRGRDPDCRVTWVPVLVPGHDMADCR